MKLDKAFIEEHVHFAQGIVPDLSDPQQVRERIVFAILSANASFDQAVKALEYCRGKVVVSRESLSALGMVPAKADWINDLPLGESILQYLRRPGEGWSDYRVRLQRSIKGLGLAKATFAACLLYPTTADLACIDTHMQQRYLDHTCFMKLGLKRYQAVEAKVRRLAQRWAIGTFVAQWVIWDYQRGESLSHNIFQKPATVSIGG